MGLKNKSFVNCYKQNVRASASIPQLYFERTPSSHIGKRDGKNGKVRYTVPEPEV